MVGTLTGGRVAPVDQASRRSARPVTQAGSHACCPPALSRAPTRWLPRPPRQQHRFLPPRAHPRRPARLSHSPCPGPASTPPPTPPRSRHHSWPTSATPPTAWTRSAQTSTEATGHALGVRAGSPRPESPQPEVDSARLLTLGQERRAYPRRSDRLCGQDRCGGIDAARAVPTWVMGGLPGGCPAQ